MCKELADIIEPYREHLPLGGTLFGFALSMASARATLEHVLTRESFERASALGEMMASRMAEEVKRVGVLPWTVQRLYCRTGITFSCTLPSSNKEYKAKEV